MNLGSQNILFLTRAMGTGGTENVILQLCEILKPLVNNIIVCSCGGRNEKILDGIGIKHYHIPDIQEKNPVKMLRTYRIIRSIVKNERITVIHSHHRMASLYAKLAGWGKAVLIANAHNTFHDKKLLTRIAYNGINLIAVGEQVKKNLEDYFGIPDGQITVIHNAVKPFASDIKEVPELVEARKKEKIIVGNIGRLSEQKGIEYFIRASGKVLERYPDMKLFIVGDGEESEKLKTLAHRILPDESFAFMGFRPDIQNIMSQMDFIVLSSLWEGLPLTPIEAFSVGKPVVATAVDGTPEIVSGGENGILVEAGNVNELAEAICMLCGDEGLRRQMGNEAYRTYSREFSFDIMAERYIEFYKELLN